MSPPQVRTSSYAYELDQCFAYKMSYNFHIFFQEGAHASLSHTLPVPPPPPSLWPNRHVVLLSHPRSTISGSAMAAMHRATHSPPHLHYIHKL